MVKSMTGYGKATANYELKTITIEIKSLNSKQLDLYVRLPNLYKEKELEIRQIISQFVERGKVECSISIEQTQVSSPLKINTDVVNDYFEQISNLANKLQLPITDRLLATILRLPESLSSDIVTISDEEWSVLKQTLEKALIEFDQFRQQEGANLVLDIRKRVQQILELLSQIEPFEKDRIEKIKVRIQSALQEAIPSNSIDNNRFEQELIYYLEKLDITEEKVRLRSHCQYFFDTLNDSEPSGRKLGFITQEIGREINTLGSKANDANIQRLVVMMKDELEKIKEQLLNIL